jgi:hypothetical protein
MENLRPVEGVPRRERDLKRVLLVCSAVVALAALPGRAQPKKPLPVGKVDVERFQSAYAAGVRLGGASKTADFPLELRALARDLQEEVVLVKTTERTEAERMFLRALSQAVVAFTSGVAIWEADTDEAKRGPALQAEALFSVEGSLWTTKEKIALLIGEGSTYLKAAGHYYAGKIGEGLAVETELSERMSARRAASAKREMRPEDFEAVRTRLYSQDVEVRRLAAVETIAFGKAATRFLPRLKELSVDNDIMTRTAALDAIARIESQ